MVSCPWIMADGSTCRAWRALQAEHCDTHAALVQHAAEVYREIQRYCEKIYKRGLQ